MNNNKAIILGTNGQDGSYLSEILLEKGYIVIGVSRRSSTDTTSRIKHLLEHPRFSYIEGDVTDPSCVNRIIEKYDPQEIYNLAAQSHVSTSFEQPKLTWDVVAGGCLNILEGIRAYNKKIKFYQASSSEMFGKNFTSHGATKWQDENTPFMPQSPYAIAKLAAHHLVRNYRESYGIFGCSGILMNHECPRRGEQFVTRKITKWIGQYKKFLNKCILNYGGTTPCPSFIVNPHHDPITIGSLKFPKLRLGNIYAYRDWGHAKDYCNAMYLMLQQDKPDDFVISTGEAHSVEQFLEKAFSYAGLNNYKDYIVIDQSLFRPSEVDYLRGDCSKAKRVLGWKPEYDFNMLVKEMVDYDIENA